MTDDLNLKEVAKNAKDNKLFWIGVFGLSISILTYAYSDFKFKTFFVTLAFAFFVMVVMFKLVK